MVCSGAAGGGGGGGGEKKFIYKFVFRVLDPCNLKRKQNDKPSSYLLLTNNGTTSCIPIIIYPFISGLMNLPLATNVSFVVV